jgi:hypothetical protein
MSGFESSLALVGVDSEDPPQGHTRMRQAMAAHLSDLRRLHIQPRIACDVCSGPRASEIDREQVRSTVAGWINLLCPRCHVRFAREDRANRPLIPNSVQR